MFYHRKKNAEKRSEMFGSPEHDLVKQKQRSRATQFLANIMRTPERIKKETKKQLS